MVYGKGGQNLACQALLSNLQLLPTNCTLLSPSAHEGGSKAPIIHPANIPYCTWLQPLWAEGPSPSAVAAGDLLGLLGVLLALGSR